MIPTSFKYEVHIRVELTREEVDFLIEACERHYDSAVRALAIPGQGAVLNGFRTGLLLVEPAHPTDTAEGEFTYRQLDTLAKGLEGPPLSIMALNLTMVAKKLMKLVTDERRRVDQNELAAPLLWTH